MRTYLISFALIAISATACDNSGNKSAVVNAGKSPVDPHTQSAGNVDSSTFTKIEWIDNDRDFGKVNEGQKVEVAFRFKNTGDNPLIIYSVPPSNTNWNIPALPPAACKKTKLVIVYGLKSKIIVLFPEPLP